MIEARGLTRTFGQVVAVDGVDLLVDRCGIVGFLGPNGAGKTTTMRMLTGYLPMTDGTAIVAGYDVFEEPLAVKARVGYLPEHPPLYHELSVGEYLSFVAEIRGIARRQRLVRVGRAMERVGLQGMERRLTGELSKGYRQRVALAQALVHDPPVLILDEPTSGLDPAQLVGIRRLIRELADERVVVLSTHVLPEVELLCDRVVLIHRGRIVGDGTVDELADEVGAGPWVELALAGDPQGIEPLLAGLEEVSTLSRLEDRSGVARYALRGGPRVTEQVAALSAAQGWRVRALVPHRASLEQVFLALVEAEA